MVKFNTYITGNKFKKLCNAVIDQYTPFLDISKKYNNIFIKTDYIYLFEKKILPHIDYPINIVTHNSDYAVPGNMLHILGNKKIQKWYGMNADVTHSKFVPIPIGIANEQWPHGDEKIIRNVNVNLNSKLQKVFCCFDPSTSPERAHIYNIIKHYNFIDFYENKLDYKTYITKLANYQWVISPPGNSIDCHRIWESIYVKTIPIVKNHICHKNWKDLPIQFVDSFNDLSFTTLFNNLNKIKTNPDSRAYMEYYEYNFK